MTEDGISSVMTVEESSIVMTEGDTLIAMTGKEHQLQ
jgi:hypothetical protein